MIECSKHLNPQNSIEQKKKQQEDGDAPDLFSGSSEKKESEQKHVEWYMNPKIKESFYDSTVLQDVCDAGARQLKAKVDPEGSNHNKRSGDSQHPPRRHLIHEHCYFKHLKQPETNTLL